jgi:hypothetical protein
MTAKHVLIISTIQCNHREDDLTPLRVAGNDGTVPGTDQNEQKKSNERSVFTL